MDISPRGGKLRWKLQSLKYDALITEHNKEDTSKGYVYY